MYELFFAFWLLGLIVLIACIIKIIAEITQEAKGKLKKEKEEEEEETLILNINKDSAYALSQNGKIRFEAEHKKRFEQAYCGVLKEIKEYADAGLQECTISHDFFVMKYQVLIHKYGDLLISRLKSRGFEVQYTEPIFVNGELVENGYWTISW